MAFSIRCLIFRITPKNLSVSSPRFSNAAKKPISTGTALPKAFSIALATTSTFPLAMFYFEIKSEISGWKFRFLFLQYIIFKNKHFLWIIGIKFSYKDLVFV